MKNLIFFFMILGFMMGGCSQSEMDLQIPENTAEINDPNFVSVEDAMKNVEQHYAATFTDKATRAGLKVKSVETFRDLTRANSDDMYGFYIINFEDNMGFSIASADVRRIPVYAISDEGSLSLSDTIDNKGLSWYINQYMPNTYMNGPNTGTDTFYPFNPAQASKTVYSEPLLPESLSKLHRGYPYNALCKTKSGEAGKLPCISIAIGKIMGYHKWPTSAQGISFNWDTILTGDVISGWAKVLELLGQSKNLNVKYDTDYTEFSGFTTKRTLDNMKFNYEVGELEPDILIKEVKAKRVILCAGEGTYESNYDEYSHNHAWLIDGAYRMTWITTDPSIDPNYGPTTVITTADYFHICWGKAGNSDVYCYLDKDYGHVYGTTCDGNHTSFGKPDVLIEIYPNK